MWPHLHGPQEDHAQLGVSWAKGGSDAGGRPDLASQLYGLRSGVLRYGQLSPRPKRIGPGLQGVNDVIMLIIDGLTSVIRVVMTSHIRKISVVKGSFDRSLLTYKSVIQALRDREPETARLALQVCYTLWRRESSKISMLSVKE